MLHILGDKISAIHSDRSYSILSMYQLYQEVRDWLESNYPGYEYKVVTANHNIIEANWSLKERKDLIQAYTESLKRAVLNYKNIESVIRIISSDTGVSGANMYPLLKLNSDKYINLGHALKTEYNATMQHFKDKLKDVYSQYTYAINGLEFLLHINIDNPVRCTGEVMKHLRLPKMMSLELIQEFKVVNKNAPCTAHEIFLNIAELAYRKRCAGVDSLSLIQVEGNIAKALRIKWADYDMPGTLSW